MATEATQPTAADRDPDAISTTAVDPNSSQPHPTSFNWGDDAKSLPLPAESLPLPSDSIQGWPHLSLMMAKTPDLASFSRFSDLHVKSLLYYQAELTLLREKIHRFEYEDAAHENWAERADKLVQSRSKQFETVKEMRAVLKDYDETLLRYSQICALPDPKPYNMKTLRKWLRSQNGGDLTVRGLSHMTWGDVHQAPFDETIVQKLKIAIMKLFWSSHSPEEELDLAATAPQRGVDRFTRWVCDAIWLWKDNSELRPWVRLPKDRPKRYEVWGIGREQTLGTWVNNKAFKVTSAISTMIASLLPVIAITILSQLEGLRNLLICLAGFSVIFALALVLLTQQTNSRTEIFAATAAFSAVMVVFISVPPAPVIDIFVSPGSATPSISSGPTPVSIGLQRSN